MLEYFRSLILIFLIVQTWLTSTLPSGLPYFSDYKMHPPEIWEENGGASYTLNVPYLAHWGGGGGSGVGFFFFSPYFPPLKSRCVL